MKWVTADLKNYCLHGLALAIIMFGLVIGWVFVLVLLMGAGSFIGLIIGFAVLFLALGYINTYLAGWVWEMSMDSDLKSVFLHGLVLFVLLLLVNIPSLVISYLVPHWIATVVLFVIYVPIHGWIGVNVAENYETAYESPVEFYPSKDL
jgi:hypothetical protein